MSNRARGTRTRAVEYVHCSLQPFAYPARGGEGFSLGAGGQFSAHADFVNAWKPGALRRLVDGCLNALVHCGRA